MLVPLLSLFSCRFRLPFSLLRGQLTRQLAAGLVGTVVVLAAIGMQAAGWKDIPPEALYRIVGALRAVGLDGEARMIAAEAIARA